MVTIVASPCQQTYKELSDPNALDFTWYLHTHSAVTNTFAAGEHLVVACNSAAMKDVEASFILGLK